MTESRPGLDYRDPKWVATQLGLDKNTVYRLLQEGTLPAVQIGKKWLISETRLAEYLEEQTSLQTTLRRIAALPAAESVLEQAHREAANYRHSYVGQEHILLALATVQGVAKDILSQIGVDEAKAAGAGDAWLVEDGMVTEGTSNNAYIVKDGKIITRELSNDILHGITRAAVLRMAAEAQMIVEERSFSIEEAQAADEAFVTSATTFVTAVVEIDGAKVGGGAPGPVANRLREIYIEESLKSAI